MFDWLKELCKKISDANCLDTKEMQMVEMALRLWEPYETILDENIGIDLITKEKADFFQLEYAIHRNATKEKM